MNSITKDRLQPGRPKTVEPWLRRAAAVEQDACLIFPFKRNKLGYGLFVASTGRENRQQRRAHNYVCEITHGPPPTPAHRALHSCDNPPCCNKRHLRWGTMKDNTDDMIERDRSCRGERSDSAKLNDETVRWIRELVAAGNRQKDIAEQLQMSRSVICEVVNRKAWRHVA